MAISKIILNGVTQMDLTSDTVAASNLLAPYTAHGADGEAVVGTASGGASNIVTGTFKGTTTGAAMDVTLNYSGSGYPIGVFIYPSQSDVSTFNSLIQRYAFRDYIADKYVRTSAPTYNTNESQNCAICTVKYKNSTSNENSYSDSGSTNSSTLFYSNTTDPTASTSLSVIMKSNNLMSVFIASTSYGFAANIEYTYHIIYSS